MKFLKTVFQEMKQTTWLSFSNLLKSTTTVIVGIVVFAIFFGIIDLGLTAALQFLLSI